MLNFSFLRETLFFVITKYFELFSVATLMLVAPSLYGLSAVGEATPYLLLMTYSAFLSIGFNQFLSNYLVVGDQVRVCVSSVFFYTAFVSILFLSTYFFFDGYSFYFLLACAFSLVRSFFQAYLRGRRKFFLLSLYNFGFGLIFLTAALALAFLSSLPFIDLFVIVYFIAYLYSFAFFALFIKFIGIRLSSFSFYFLMKKLKTNLYLFFSSVAVSLLLTFDRLYFSSFGSAEFLGMIQALDSVAMIFYLGLASVSYVMVPRLLSMYAKKKRVISKEVSLKILFIQQGLGFAFFLIASPLVELFYHITEHGIFASLLFYKSCLLFLAVVYILCVSSSKERKYFEVLAVALAIIFFLGLTFIFVGLPLPLFYLAAGISVLLLSFRVVFMLDLG